MEIGIMITDGGPHSPEKWAETTASHVVTISDNVAGERKGSAIKLQAAIIDILEGHHKTVQNGERAAIKEHGNDRLQHPITHNDHVNVDDVIKDIVTAGVGTPWESDFKKPEFQSALKLTLADHFMQSAFIERSWHADRNGATVQAQAFHKQFRG